MRRAAIIVLDGVGIGSAPDAHLMRVFVTRCDERRETLRRRFPVERSATAGDEIDCPRAHCRGNVYGAQEAIAFLTPHQFEI